MPTLKNHVYIRKGGKLIPGKRSYRKATKFGRGLYLHGQSGSSIKSVLKSALAGFKKILPKIGRFITKNASSAVKKYGPAAAKALGNVIRDKAIPAATTKLADKLKLKPETRKGLESLAKNVGKRATQSMEDLATQQIRRFTGDGLSLHGQGLSLHGQALKAEKRGGKTIKGNHEYYGKGMKKF